MNFSFFLPTRIIFGRTCIKTEPGYLSSFGNRALIVTGRHSSKKNGSERDVCSALQNLNIKYTIFDQVEPNPSIETVRAGAQLARKENVDFIIGIGGGSPLDAAKAVAVLIKNDLSNEKIFSGDFKEPILPIVAVPTTSGTGSEVTPYSILTDKSVENKRNLSTVGIFPKIAYCDPGYTDVLPKKTTINTAIDALSHSIEGYLSKRATLLSKTIAIESIRTIGFTLREIAAGIEPEKTTRDHLMYGALLGGIVIAQTGTTALHAMGYPLTYFKGIDHGRANGLLMHEYLKYIYKEHPGDVDHVLQAMGLPDLSAMKSLLSSLLGTPEKVTPEEISQFAEISIEATNVQKTRPVPDQKDIEEIFSSVFISS